MALETGSFVIGAASLIAGFKGAVDGCVFLSDLYHGFDDASFYATKLEIERQRLEIWGAFFGIREDSSCEKLLDQPEAVQSLIFYILKEFIDATRNLEQMRSKYGLEPIKQGAEAPSPHFRMVRVSTLLDELAALQKEQTGRLKWWKKGFSWALHLPKFEKLLDRLEYLNDSLERMVPQAHLPVLAQGLPSFLVPDHSHESLKTYQQSPQEVLALCATAKTIKLDTTVISKVPEIGLGQLEYHGQPVQLSDGASRHLALLREKDDSNTIQQVIVDWKQPNDTLTPDERQEVRKRIKALCLLFSKISDHPNSLFRALPCLGLVEDPAYARDHLGHKKQGFVFRYPEPDSGTPESLLECFKTLPYVPVGERFRLAQNLASSVLLLHSSSWLHKNICSSNVLVFKPHSQDADDTSYIMSPYLTGFSYARPDAPGEASMEKPQTGTLDFYRRPSSESGSSRYNDIYSLGVVMFEIGIWQRTKAAVKDGQYLYCHRVSMFEFQFECF
ncbi:hypothetical protein ACHAPT_013245 [Fusarium lateritium]